ncbi:unnamed protein product [Cochlearia groenlandica]
MKAIFSRRVVIDLSSRLAKSIANPTTTHYSHPNHHSLTTLFRPNQTRHFRTQYLLPRPSPATTLCRSEKIRGVFTSVLRKKASNFGNLVESKVDFFGSQFPKKGFGFDGYSGLQKRGLKHWLQGLSANDVVLGLIIANASVFLMWRVFNNRFMMNNFMISLDNFTSGRIHTVITSAFSHIDVGHIISNMIGLYFFGINIARNFGPQFLLKLYFAGALGGSVFYLIHHAYMAVSSPKGRGAFTRDPSRTPGLGASGAVNAIMLLDIFLNPKATLYFEFIIPVPAMLLGVFLIGKDILRITEGDSNISGAAHLGGAAVAAIAWARIRRGRFRY